MSGLTAGLRLGEYVLLLSVGATAHAQILIQRHPERMNCPRTHVRLTARQPDGQPIASLHSQDLYLWFSLGTAEVESVRNGAPSPAGTPDTDVLLVARPFADVDPTAIEGVLRSMRAAAGFHWQSAVLAADGSLSSFTGDASVLRAALLHAVAPATQPLGIAEWAGAERRAFAALRERDGRHVMVELARTSAETTGPAVDFAQDRTLDLVARDDMTQIYRLADVRSSELGAGGQQHTSPARESSGGQSAASVDALIEDIVKDAPGSYDLIVHPLFACKEGASYSLGVRSFLPNAQLFYPSMVRIANAGDGEH